MRGYKTQNDNTSFDHNVNMDQNCNQSGQSNHADVNPKPSNLKMIFIATIVITVGIFAGYMLYGGDDDDNGGNVNNDGNKEDTEENMTATTGSENGHDWVDLGLPSGIKWATTNVGANAPEEYGDYFAWGETSAKSTYGWSTYKWCKGTWRTLTKYCINPSYGAVDNKTTLDSTDDAAHMNWGGNWRMPSEKELEELLDNCDWIWTSMNGMNGYKVSARNNNNFIFLPAAGYLGGGDGSLVGKWGYYWSSTRFDYSSSYNAYSLQFYQDDYYRPANDRYKGFPVRPVCL